MDNQISNSRVSRVKGGRVDCTALGVDILDLFGPPMAVLTVINLYLHPLISTNLEVGS